ncbi:hypothetical protein GCM10007049_33210 [Echinicola pacifica]|uniref:DUF1735 domain-containing protein n=1 Tax=Echinicola pacifica TaxID=346377 RepID=A0A918QAR6_9BACT|nr:DUF5627 domain-containing protein [Echinicola pacifica]GGZ37363.1 hypothetical protein GCM10007049_33210 [Echinicola pacifica]
MKNIVYTLLALVLIFSSCQNQDWDFPNFDYQTVYFAYQFPVRTITLGEDLFDTSLDNEGKFKLMVSTGGVYASPNNITVQVEVDESLAAGLLFEEGGDQVEVLPIEYYQLSTETITIPKGEVAGGVEIQLTGAFFNDPRAIRKTFVLPVKITQINNADSVLSGIPIVDNPRRAISADWAPAPKDFTLYALKYINPWHGNYLRRGRDIITNEDGSVVETTIIRHEEFVEDDEINSLLTQSLSQVVLPLRAKGKDGNEVVADLLLTFEEDGSCLVSSPSADYTAEGTGKFIKDGEKSSWGDQDRDALYLDYEIEFADMKLSSVDTLVLRDRGVGIETFSPVAKQ